MVAAVAQEAVRHEGGEQGDVPVGLLHLHLAQLHLDGLQQHSPEPLSPAPGTAPGTQQLLQDGAAAESCTEEKAAGADVRLPMVCSAPGAQQAHSLWKGRPTPPQLWHTAPSPRGCFARPALLLPYLGVGLRLCKLDLEVEHLGGRLLLLLCRRLLLTHELPVHVLSRERSAVRQS